MLHISRNKFTYTRNIIHQLQIHMFTLQYTHSFNHSDECVRVRARVRAFVCLCVRVRAFVCVCVCVCVCVSVWTWKNIHQIHTFFTHMHVFWKPWHVHRFQNLITNTRTSVGVYACAWVRQEEGETEYVDVCEYGMGEGASKQTFISV